MPHAMFQLSRYEQESQEKEAHEKEILAGLASASGLMRNEIGKQVRMRRTRKRIFKMDHSTEYGEHIDKILDSMDFDSYQKDEDEGGEDPAE